MTIVDENEIMATKKDYQIFEKLLNKRNKFALNGTLNNVRRRLL